MRNAVFSLVATSIIALLTFWLILDPFRGDWTVPAFHLPVTHTVLFQFKKDADPDHVRKVWSFWLTKDSHALRCQLPPQRANVLT
jgi:hypothetical protein